MKVSGNIQNYKCNQDKIPKHPVKFNGLNKAIQEVITEQKNGIIAKYGIQLFEFLGRKKGEALTNTINGIGTGLVAPLFIFYNPLSAQDKDTRKYSAWRQPLSAVLSVVIQVGVTLKLNDFLDKLADKGKLHDKFCIKLPERFKTALDKYKNNEKIKKLEQLDQKAFKENVKEKLSKFKESIVYKSLTNNTAETLQKYGLAENDIKEMLVKDRVKSALKKAIEKDPELRKLRDEAIDFVEENIENTKLEKISAFIKGKIKGADTEKGVLDKLKKAFEAAEASEKKLFETKLTEKEFKEMANKIIKITEGRHKALKNIVGALVAMALVPFTCSALNWVYPRFMEKFFPELSQVKKQGGK